MVRRTVLKLGRVRNNFGKIEEALCYLSKATNILGRLISELRVYVDLT